MTSDVTSPDSSSFASASARFDSASIWRRLPQGRRRPKALLFDLDGVLADVSQSYRRAIIETARHLGGEIKPGEVLAAKAAGSANNDWVLTHRLLAAQDITVSLDEVTRCFEGIYQGSGADDGLWREETLIVAADLVDRLAKWAHLGIVTGRPRRDALRFLEQMGIAAPFEALVCMEDAPSKPDPAPVRMLLGLLGCAPTDAWLIGDTPDDMRAACGADVSPFGVVAPGDPVDAVTRTLVDAGAVYVLPQLSDLERLIEATEIES